MEMSKGKRWDNRNEWQYQGFKVEPWSIFYGVSPTFGQTCDYKSIRFNGRDRGYSKWWGVHTGEGLKWAATKQHAKVIIDTLTKGSHD